MICGEPFRKLCNADFMHGYEDDHRNRARAASHAYLLKRLLLQLVIKWN